MENYDYEIEKRYHPENFLAQSEMDAEEEEEILKEEGFIKNENERRE